MNLNILLRDSLIHMVINVGIFGLLMQYEFELTSRTFTLLLGLNLFLVCVITGISAKKLGGNSSINGWMVGVISYAIMLLILVQFVDFSLEVNMFLFAIWSTLGFFGGFVGGIIGKPHQPTRAQVAK